MKTSLLILAILACACVAYARPDAEESKTKDSKKVLIDLDELETLLRTKFGEEKFLEEKLGKPEGCPQFSDRGKWSWVGKLPWGTIIDAVVDLTKKLTE